MTVHLVTFSDESMSRARDLCASSAKAYGVDEAWQYEQRFMGVSRHVVAHPEVFTQPIDHRRAWAWWAWKPVIIEDTMRRAVECYSGDQYVIYSDAGVEFINNVSHIIERMDQDIFLFGNNYEHAYWCKRDVVDEVWELPAYDDPYLDYSPLRKGALVRDEDGGLSWGNFSKQVQASVIFFRVSDYTRAFVKEWLDWCLFEGGRLIDDSPSRLPNHPEFQEHRHDQAILTTMAYRDGLKLHYWSATYNDGAFNYQKLPEYAGDDYPILCHHHRRRNHEWSGPGARYVGMTLDGEQYHA